MQSLQCQRAPKTGRVHFPRQEFCADHQDDLGGVSYWLKVAAALQYVAIDRGNIDGDGEDADTSRLDEDFAFERETVRQGRPFYDQAHHATRIDAEPGLTVIDRMSCGP